MIHVTTLVRFSTEYDTLLLKLITDGWAGSTDAAYDLLGQEISPYSVELNITYTIVKGTNQWAFGAKMTTY